MTVAPHLHLLVRPEHSSGADSVAQQFGQVNRSIGYLRQTQGVSDNGFRKRGRQCVDVSYHDASAKQQKIVKVRRTFIPSSCRDRINQVAAIAFGVRRCPPLSFFFRHCLSLRHHPCPAEA
jgi:hypothetical protein